MRLLSSLTIPPESAKIVAIALKGTRVFKKASYRESETIGLRSPKNGFREHTTPELQEVTIRAVDPALRE